MEKFCYLRAIIMIYIITIDGLKLDRLNVYNTIFILPRPLQRGGNLKIT